MSLKNLTGRLKASPAGLEIIFNSKPFGYLKYAFESEKIFFQGRDKSY